MSGMTLAAKRPRMDDDFDMDSDDSFTADDFDLCQSQAVMMSQALSPPKRAPLSPQPSTSTGLASGTSGFGNRSDTVVMDRDTVYELQGQARNLRQQLASTRKELFALKTQNQAAESAKLTSERKEHERVVNRLTSELKFKEQEMRNLKEKLFLAQYQNSVEIPATQTFVKPKAPASLLVNSSFTRSRTKSDHAVQTESSSTPQLRSRTVFKVTRRNRDRPMSTCYDDVAPLTAYANAVTSKTGNLTNEEILLGMWLRGLGASSLPISDCVQKALADNAKICLSELSTKTVNFINNFLIVLEKVYNQKDVARFNFVQEIDWKGVMRLGDDECVASLVSLAAVEGLVMDFVDGESGFFECLRHRISKPCSWKLYREVSKCICRVSPEIDKCSYLSQVAKELLNSIYLSLNDLRNDVDKLTAFKSTIAYALNACCDLNERSEQYDLENAICNLVSRLSAYPELESFTARIVRIWPYTSSDLSDPDDEDSDRQFQTQIEVNGDLDMDEL